MILSSFWTENTSSVRFSMTAVPQMLVNESVSSSRVKRRRDISRLKTRLLSTPHSRHIDVRKKQKKESPRSNYKEPATTVDCDFGGIQFVASLRFL